VAVKVNACMEARKSIFRPVSNHVRRFSLFAKELRLMVNHTFVPDDDVKENSFWTGE
jgi:hypothetical protein